MFMYIRLGSTSPSFFWPFECIEKKVSGCKHASKALFTRQKYNTENIQIPQVLNQLFKWIYLAEI